MLERRDRLSRGRRHRPSRVRHASAVLDLEQLEPRLLLTAELSGAFADLDPAIVVPRDKHTAALTVSNNGDTDAEKFLVEFYLSTDNVLDAADLLLDQEKIRGINAGEQQEVDLKFKIPETLLPGGYHILADIDAENVIAEADNLADSGQNVNLVFMFGTFGGRKNVKLRYTRDDGAQINISMRGPAAGELNLIPGTNEADMTITGSDAKTSVAAKAKRGTGRFPIRDFTADGPFGTFKGPTTDISRTFDVNGAINVATLGHLTDADVSVDSVGGKLKFGTMTNTIITLLQGGTAVQSEQWVGGAFNTQWFTRFDIKGNRKLQIPGLLDIDIFAAGGNGDAPTVIAGNIKVADDILGGTWFIDGPGKNITADSTGPNWRANFAGSVGNVKIGDRKTGGETNSDAITSEPTITGTVTDISGVAELSAGLNDAPPDQFVDVLAAVGNDGSFTIDELLLNQINDPVEETSLADGDHILHLRSRDTGGRLSMLDVPFTLDTTGPSLPALTPTDSEQEVLPGQLIEAVFDEMVVLGNVVDDVFNEDAAGSLSLSSLDGIVLGRAMLDDTATRLILIPDDQLPGGSDLTAVVDGTMVFDVAGNEAGYTDVSVQFTTINNLGIPGTSVVGFVFDSALDDQGGDIPLPGATVSVTGQPGNTTVTDAAGRLQLDNVPGGRLLIGVDGRTVAAPPGTFYPTVAEVIHAVAGQSVDFAEPVYLPLATEADFVTVDNTPGAMTEVTNEAELPGWKLMVPGGAVQRRDGSMAEQVLLAAVPPDRLPAPLPEGMTPDLVITIQTEGGADVFTQPVPLTAPNLEGLAPGERTVLWDFDHARGQFVPVATATVSEDGLTITTDPGQGVLRPGWHFFQGLFNYLRDAFHNKPPKQLSPEQLDEFKDLLGKAALSGTAAGLDIASFLFPGAAIPLGALAAGSSIARGAMDGAGGTVGEIGKAVGRRAMRCNILDFRARVLVASDVCQLAA